MAGKSQSKFICGAKLYKNLVKLRGSRDGALNEDALSFLLGMVKSISVYKSLFVIVSLMFWLNTFGMLYYFVDLIATFDIKLLMDYGGHAAIQMFLLASLANAIILGGRVADYGSDFQRKLLPLQFAKERTQKNIQSQITLLKAVVYVDIACVVMAAGLFSVDKSFNENNVYFFLITKKMFSPYLGRIIFLLYRLNYFVLAFVSLGASFITCYIGFHAKFQIMIIKDFIEHICDGNSDQEEEQYYNETNQALIAEKLKICFMLYHLVYSEVRNFMVLSFNATLLIFTGVLFLGGGMMVEIFSQSELQSSLPAIFLVALSGVLNAGLYAVAGQTIKDESEDLRLKLLDLPWYNMNTKNKRILCIFWMRTENLISFDISLVQIDFLLIVRIFRGLYSLSTILSQSMKMKNK